jgi:hypothetical protein
MATITSPAGETIEVVSDEDFMELYDVNAVDIRIWNPKLPILKSLWLGGMIEDSISGRATRMLWERARTHGYKAAMTGVASMLQQNALKGCVDRENNGKRTYWYRLARLPQSWADKLVALTPKAKPPAQSEEEKPSNPEPVAVAVSHPEDVGEDVAAAVARELLAEVVRIINAPPPQPQVVTEKSPDPEVLERLSKALEYGQKLRRELSETGDELRAVKQERDTLRQRLHIAEANMDKALGDGRRFVDEEVRKQLGKIMSARPTTTKGDDDA